MRRSEFWIYIDYEPLSKCWLWMRRTDSAGYGDAYVKGISSHRAHRISWQLTNGPIRDGLLVCHKCHVPACINPAHLYLGTQKNNYEDAAARGIQKQSLEEWAADDDLNYQTLLIDTDLRDSFGEYVELTACGKAVEILWKTC